MPKSKLYQCPYEVQCKCNLSESCLGCETWAEHYGKFDNSLQQLKAEIAAVASRLECAWSYQLLEVVKTEIITLRQLSAV